MKNTKKKLKGQSRVVKYSFTGSNITKYSGLNTVAKYMNKQGIIKSVSTLFPTQWHSATKFGVNQVLIFHYHGFFLRDKPNLQNCIVHRWRVDKNFVKTEQGNKRKCYIHNTEESWPKWRPEITIIFVVKKCTLAKRKRPYKYNTGCRLDC